MCAVSGCGNLIGLGGYSVADETAEEAAGTANVAGGNAVGSSGAASVETRMGDGGTSGAPDESGGSAGEGGAFASGGSSTEGGDGGTGAAVGGGTGGSAGGSPSCPNGCEDSNDCTTDSCKMGVCAHDSVPMGTACGVGRSCDAQTRCVRCRDTASGNAQDAGCTSTAPVCLGTGLDAACAGCSTPADCNDDNECTTEACTAGKCVFGTVAAGSACAGGVCNGTASAEKCVACADTAGAAAPDSGCTPAKPVCDPSGTPTCYECLSNTDCPTDNVSCTVETCSNHACSHVTTDSLCAVSSDACKPNKCDAVSNCKSVDITSTKPVIGLGSAQGNGGFEQASGTGAAGWADIGSFEMIFNCTPTGAGCAGANGTTYTGTGTVVGGDFLAWLGGTTSASITGIDHLIVLPLGTTKLQVMADINFQTKSQAPTNNDVFQIRLLDSAKTVTPAPAAVLFATSNVIAQTGTSRSWTKDGINVTSDVSAYAASHAGADSYVSFWSSVDASLRTDFFIDNVRVTATVCQ